MTDNLARRYLYSSITSPFFRISPPVQYSNLHLARFRMGILLYLLIYPTVLLFNTSYQLHMGAWLHSKGAFAFLRAFGFAFEQYSNKTCSACRIRPRTGRFTSELDSAFEWAPFIIRPYFWTSILDKCR